MKCRDFQKKIPNIITKNIPVSEFNYIIEHVENCKECYDELEIHYVLQYGLGDDDENISMDFRCQLENNIREMKRKLNRYEMMRSIYAFIVIAANTAIGGTFIYVLFNYFL